jgi:hypothetical protein
LHDPASDPPVPREFFQLVSRLRRSRGTLWGINTGRSLEHLLEGFRESAFPFLPDWVVAREREIYFADGDGSWLPHSSWNRRCKEEIHALFSEAADLMCELRHRIEEHTGARWFEADDDPAGVIARTEEEIAWIMENVIPLAGVEPRLAWERNTIYLRFGHRDFHKGSCVAEIARIHRLGAEHCFAIGDSHNDIGMLDPAHAAMTACPANALAEIRAHVESHGGLVARAAHGDGAIEALRHYFERTED